MVMIHNKAEENSLRLIFRLHHRIVLTQRLLGTNVYLYDADGTTLIADCGKITDVNTETDLPSQTYTLPCDTPQLASYVKLKDSEIASGEGSIVMNIAEVKVYGSSQKPGRDNNVHLTGTDRVRKYWSLIG
eukprot:sb/3475112/